MCVISIWRTLMTPGHVCVCVCVCVCLLVYVNVFSSCVSSSLLLYAAAWGHSWPLTRNKRLKYSWTVASTSSSSSSSWQDFREGCLQIASTLPLTGFHCFCWHHLDAISLFSILWLIGLLHFPIFSPWLPLSPWNPLALVTFLWLLLIFVKSKILISISHMHTMKKKPIQKSGMLRFRRYLRLIIKISPLLL